MKKIFYLFLFFSTGLMFHGIAQQKVSEVPKAGNGLYIKSCERVAVNMKSCVLCEDVALKKNCKTFTCDDGNQCADIMLGAIKLQEIVKLKSPALIRGIKKEAGPNNETLYYLADKNFRTYIKRNGNILEFVEFQESTNPKGEETAIAKQIGLTPKENCANDCNKFESACENKCKSENCKDQCLISCKTCRTNCRLYVPKSTYSVPLNVKQTGSIQIF